MVKPNTEINMKYGKNKNYRDQTEIIEEIITIKKVKVVEKKKTGVFERVAGFFKKPILSN